MACVNSTLKVWGLIIAIFSACIKNKTPTIWRWIILASRGAVMMTNDGEYVFDFGTSSNTSGSLLNDENPHDARDSDITEDLGVADNSDAHEDSNITQDPDATADPTIMKETQIMKDAKRFEYPQVEEESDIMNDDHKVTTDPKVTTDSSVATKPKVTEGISIAEGTEVTPAVTVTAAFGPPDAMIGEKLESNLDPDIQPLQTSASTSTEPSSSPGISDMKPKCENWCPSKERYFQDWRAVKDLDYIEAPNTYETYQNLLKTLLRSVITTAADQQAKVWKAEFGAKFSTGNVNPKQRKKARYTLKQKIRDLSSSKITYTRLLEFGEMISKAGLSVDQEAQSALDSMIKIRAMMSWDTPSISNDSPAGIREIKEGRGKGQASDPEDIANLGKAKDIRTVIDNHREIYHILTQLRQLLVRDDNPAQNQQNGVNTGNKTIEENKSQDNELPQHNIANQEDASPITVHKRQEYDISFPSYPWVQGDLYFQVLCFIRDVRVIHDICEACWKTVKPLGETSRVTASFMTQQALMLINSLEYQFSRSMDKYKMHSGPCCAHSQDTLWEVVETIVVQTFGSSDWGETLSNAQVAMWAFRPYTISMQFLVYCRTKQSFEFCCAYYDNRLLNRNELPQDTRWAEDTFYIFQTILHYGRLMHKGSIITSSIPGYHSFEQFIGSKKPSMAVIFVFLVHLSIFYIRRETHSLNDWGTFLEEARLICDSCFESLEKRTMEPATLDFIFKLGRKLGCFHTFSERIDHIRCGSVYLQRQIFSSTSNDTASHLRKLLLMNRLVPNSWFCGIATAAFLMEFLANFPYQFLYAKSRTLGAVHAWHMADKLGLIEAGKHGGFIQRMVDHGFFGDFDNCQLDLLQHYTKERLRWENYRGDLSYPRKPITCTWLWRINCGNLPKLADVTSCWKPKINLEEQHDAQHLFRVYLDDVRRLIEYESGSFFINFHVIEDICTEFEKRVFEDIMDDIKLWRPDSEAICRQDWHAVFGAAECGVAMQKLKRRIEEYLYTLDVQDQALMFIKT
ncbi:hypothetical protein BZA77DRAFT_371184 [Pyronema omphalodes]|nr:hypothetical protein BZA77DRAFT_371184 [Pyronema omphalodes]